jgi:P63C domain
MKKKQRLASEAAKALSDLGAAKASVLTDVERKEIARKAAEARWGPRKDKATSKKEEQLLSTATVADSSQTIVDATEHSEAGPAPDRELLPYPMFRGTLPMGDVEMECHVLNNGARVLTQREVVRVLTGGRESGNLQRYLDRNPLTARDFELGPTIRFSVPGTGMVSIGHEATSLIDVCDRYVQARYENLLKPSQYKLADQAKIVIRSCAKVGIIALIDEATGFQKFRAENALRLKFQAFIADEIQEWAIMFPQEFWVELARLEGVHYSPRSRPLRWGKYVMMFVYDAIDPDIGNWLRQNNPDPHYKKNHHQWLKEFGREKVHDQITKVVTIMKLCRDMTDFRAKFAHVIKKTPLQLSFEDFNWTTGE